MAKNIEYEEDDELPQVSEEENDGLDFEDTKPAKPFVNGGEAKQITAKQMPAKKRQPVQPAQTVQAAAVQEQEPAAEPIEQITPEEQAQRLWQNLFAKLEELDARMTRLESDLYRQR